MSSIGGGWGSDDSVGGGWGTGQGPSSVDTGGNQQAGIPGFAQRQRPIIETKPITNPESGASTQSGRPESAEPAFPTEAVVMCIALKVPKDKVKDLISSPPDLTSSLPDFAEVTGYRVFRDDAPDRLGL
jgi:hypothetical protein